MRGEGKVIRHMVEIFLWKRQVNIHSAVEESRDSAQAMGLKAGARESPEGI
jgi:hypothetical protein